MRKKVTPPETKGRQLETKGRKSEIIGVVTARTEENDPFVRRLGDLWRAAREHNQHETAQVVQDMLLTYKGLKNRRDRRWFARKADASLAKLEAPYLPDPDDFLSEDDF